MTMKYTLEDCAIEMHSEGLRRTRYDAEKDTFDTSVTVSQAYEIAESIVSREWNPGRPPGTRVNDRNEVVPIRAPRSETKPAKRLVPVTIDSLVEADGNINKTEIDCDDIDIADADDPRELGQPAPTPVAGEDTPDDEEADLDADVEESDDGNSD